METKSIIVEQRIDGVMVKMEIPLHLSESLSREEEEAFHLAYEPLVQRIAHYMVAVTSLGEIGISTALPIIERHIQQAAEEMLLAVRGMQVAETDTYAYIG